MGQEVDRLVYVGKIIRLDPIEGADFILCATVVCGEGGKWRGVVKKGDYQINDLCVVFLPDSIIPPSDELKFMERHNWRVKMMKFRGAPSEVLIIACDQGGSIGDNVTEHFGVTKYYKTVPTHLNGTHKGEFPGLIPKTDEPNHQRSEDLILALIGNPWYITEKMDGSSTTAYKHKGSFGVCSRNFDLVRDSQNGYWKVADKYKVEEKLPEGIAIQWETCGPGIQKNPSGLKEIDGFMFSAYNIPEDRYLELKELKDLSKQIGFPMVRILDEGTQFIGEGIDTLGAGVYQNGKPREGVVVRSQFNLMNGKPISFKVINLDYET